MMRRVRFGRCYEERGMVAAGHRGRQSVTRTIIVRIRVLQSEHWSLLRSAGGRRVTRTSQRMSSILDLPTLPGLVATPSRPYSSTVGTAIYTLRYYTRT